MVARVKRNLLYGHVDWRGGMYRCYRITKRQPNFESHQNRRYLLHARRFNVDVNPYTAEQRLEPSIDAKTL